MATATELVAAAPAEGAADSPAPWLLDVQVEVAALDTTGGKVWRAAQELCAFLEQRAGDLGLPRPPAAAECGAPGRGGGDGAAAAAGRRGRVLEIGAGCGWLGLCLARNSPGLDVFMTEQPAGLEHLQRNVELNQRAGLPVESVHAAVLDWSDCSADSLLQQTWDLVIGSDLLYSEQGLSDLPALFRRLAGPGTRVLYAHTLHRYDHLDVEFFKALEAAGLDYQEVGDLPPEDEAFLQELFPEERAAVFEICHASGPSRCLLPRLESRARQGERPSILLAPSPHLPGGAVATVAAGPRAAAPPAAPAARSSAEVAADLGLHVLLPREEDSQAAQEGAEDEEEEARRSGLPVLRLAVVGPFGNASHPTTRLVMRWLAGAEGRAAVGGAEVCDYGCGSGILGLTALIHGAARCASVDNDLAALRAARANAEANGLCLDVRLPPSEALQKDIDFYSRFGDWRTRDDGWSPLDLSAPGAAEAEAEAGGGGAGEGGGPFGVVLCNIVVGPLCSVAPTLARLCRTGGVVALAGFRGDHMRKQVEDAYSPFFDLQEASREDGWQLLIGLRAARSGADAGAV